MTTLQMSGIFQTIANDGVRVPPRGVAERVGPDGDSHVTQRPEGVRVVSDETATTGRALLRPVLQPGPGAQAAAGPQAALSGAQVRGKTGTAENHHPAG